MIYSPFSFYGYIKGGIDSRLDEDGIDSSELALLTNIYCRKNSGAETRTNILCSIRVFFYNCHRV